MIVENPLRRVPGHRVLSLSSAAGDLVSPGSRV